MTYAANEASVEDGDPVELFEFIGTENTYRFTSSEKDISFDSDGGGPYTFNAIGIERGNVSQPSDGQAPTITVTVPIDEDLVERFVLGIAPPDLEMKLYRLHQTSGLSATIWRGDVNSWSIKGRGVDFVIPNGLVQAVKEDLPRARYQVYCNNVLYDERCGLDPDLGNRRHSTTISAISADGRTITVASNGGYVDGYFDGGALIHTSSGERRTIQDQTGTSILVQWPFSANVDTTEGCILERGCNHSIQDCDEKHFNTDNFNGMPLIAPQSLNRNQGS